MSCLLGFGFLANEGMDEAVYSCEQLVFQVVQVSIFVSLLLPNSLGFELVVVVILRL